MFLLGFYLAFTVLHAALYVFDRREKGSLYLAASTAGFSLSLWTDQVEDFTLGMLVLATLGITTMILGFIRFGHWFIRQPSPWIFRAFVLLGVIAVASPFLTGGSMLVTQLITLMSLVELVRMLVIGVRARREDPRSWIVGLGFLVIFVAALFETLGGLRILPREFNGIYQYGMVFLFMALSAYLSLTFADTRRSLERRLAEVESLSEEAVEQEREAQLRASERRVLEKDLEQKQRELDNARDLQLSLLPPGPPNLDTVEIDFAMRTASEVGGDYYDFRTDRGALTIAVGDASGHGLDASLLAVTAKGLFHAAEGRRSLVEQLEVMAAGFRGMHLERRFMAVSLLRWTPASLEIVSAGMPAVLIARRDSGTLDEVASHGPPLGTLASHTYTSTTIALAPGDTVLAVSDGLPERLNGDGEQMGYETLASTFLQDCSGPLCRVKSAVLAAVDAWATGHVRDDDETVVLLRPL